MSLLQALVNNPKIEVIDGKYAFKPKYNLKDKKALLRLLDQHDQRGLGGILLEDIEEGLPNSQKAVKVTSLLFLYLNITWTDNVFWPRKKQDLKKVILKSSPSIEDLKFAFCATEQDRA